MSQTWIHMSYVYKLYINIVLCMYVDVYDMNTLYNMYSNNKNILYK